MISISVLSFFCVPKLSMKILERRAKMAPLGFGIEKIQHDDSELKKNYCIFIYFRGVVLHGWFHKIKI